MKTESIYKEEIMEIYNEKPNFGKLKNKTHEFSLKNPGCNDNFKIQLEIKDDKIKDAKFEGKGCVISTVSISLLLEKIKGMKLEDAKKISKKEMDKILNLEITPARANCELLGVEILKRIK